MKLGFKKNMERNRISSESSASSSPTSTSGSSRSAMVLAVECIRGTSNAEEWSGNLLHTGDIVEEIKISGQIHRAPFKNGKSGVQKLLRSSFHSHQTSITVRVSRRCRDGASEDLTELQACIVPGAIGGKKQYVIRGINDPHYAIRFFDRTEAECLELQASRSSRMQEALDTAKLQDGYVGYPWERRMQGMLKVPNSSSFLSILFLPFQPSSDDQSRGPPSRYNDIEDTLARANAWLNASQSSGVPIVFTNIQTESLLTKISGEVASCRNTSLSDLSKLANSSLYGFEDYHGIDIGVVRAVRLWYSPIGEEYRVAVDIREGDTKLGFAISRSEEGFIYISSVLGGDENVPSSRSGLSKLHKEATRAGKLLVVSRIDNQKVLPWLVSSSGGIRCFDTVSLSQKLSLHRHAGVTMLIHILMWDPELQSSTPQSGSPFRSVPVQTGYPSITKPDSEFSDDEDDDDDTIELRLERDTAGEASFRFDQCKLPNSWV
ncbi:hypothetical protein V2J09_018469 [Rumex salicifolius]